MRGERKEEGKWRMRMVRKEEEGKWRMRGERRRE